MSMCGYIFYSVKCVDAFPMISISNYTSEKGTCVIAISNQYI